MRYSSTLLNQCILDVTLNLDLSTSLFCITLMCGHKCLVRISDRYVHYLWIFVLICEKRFVLYKWHIWLPWKHMLPYFDHIIFCKVHSVDPTNVCANFEINRYTH